MIKMMITREICIVRLQKSAQRALQELCNIKTLIKRDRITLATKHVTITTIFKYMPLDNSHITLYTHGNPYSTLGTNTSVIGSACARWSNHNCACFWCCVYILCVYNVMGELFEDMYLNIVVIVTCFVASVMLSLLID